MKMFQIMCKSYAINYFKNQYLKPCYNKNLLTFKILNLWGPKHRTTFGDNSIGLNFNHWYLIELSCNRVFGTWKIVIYVFFNLTCSQRVGRYCFNLVSYKERISPDFPIKFQLVNVEHIRWEIWNFSQYHFERLYNILPKNVIGDQQMLH
jgi:hypothetical protein